MYHHTTNESIEIALKKRIRRQFDANDVYREINVLSKCGIMSGVEDRMKGIFHAQYPGDSKHPNIVGFIGFYINEKDEICLLLELLQGKSLSRFCPEKTSIFAKIFSFFGKERRTSEPELHSIHQTISIIQQICTGMEFLSKLGIIHMDLAARNCVYRLNFL